MIYRVKQFFWGLRAKISDEDRGLVYRYLDAGESDLFFRLPQNEAVHSVRVAREVISECLKYCIEDDIVIRAAFLHDIGKIDSGLNIFSKSIIVILNRVFPKQLKKLIGLKSVNAYYNHPEIAMGYLGEKEELLKYYILNHHNYDIKTDTNLKILQRADSTN